MTMMLVSLPPGGVSIDLDLDHELLELLSPEHSHGTSLSPLTAPPVTNCRSSRPNYTGTFQCHSTSEDANFRDRSSDGSGRGSRSSGCPVSRRGRRFVVCTSRSVWCKKNTGRRLCFVFFSRESPPRAHPDRRPDLCYGFCRPAGLRSPEFHFGHFASRAWRLLGGHPKKSEVFSLLRERIRFFLNSAFWNQLLYPRDGQ